MQTVFNTYHDRFINDHNIRVIHLSEGASPTGISRWLMRHQAIENLKKAC
jgi:hypothetical protein